MAYVASFAQVQQLLAARRARLVKQTRVGDVYVDAHGQYIKVARNGGGYDVQVFGSLAACGCE